MSGILSRSEAFPSGVSRKEYSLSSLPLVADPSKPPYAPQIALLGGEPTIPIDVPICAVLICLYALAAASYQTLFQLNRRRGHRFIIMQALFGFCMARIMTCSLRIAWATHRSNVSLAIVATLLVNVGILMVYLVNLIFVQRILRATRPKLGWHPTVNALFAGLYALIGMVLVLLIVFTVLTFYTLDTHLLKASRDVQLAATTFLLVVAALPLVLLSTTILPPRNGDQESFGRGSMRAKILILTAAASLCTLASGFKVGVNWQTPRPVGDPAWYHSRMCFYVFTFVPELLLLCLYFSVRIDKRFWVPDGSGKKQTYQLQYVDEVRSIVSRETAESRDLEKSSVCS